MTHSHIMNGQGMRAQANTHPTRQQPHARRAPIPFRVAMLPLLVAGAFQVAGVQAQVANTALPTGGVIRAGQGAISANGANMLVQQNSARLITNWQSFNIGRDASVVFAQPNAQAIALNRVMAGDASRILGQMRANGQVFLLNPQGVVFGSSARVDVGGLVASSMAMSDEDFLAGRLRFTAGPGAGAVSNAGEINGGYVALVAPSVANTGAITAGGASGGGQVALAAGSAATLQLDGAGLINVQVDPSTAASIANSGNIIADGGRIWMTANQAAPAAASAINQTGTVRANSLVARNGEIFLDGGRGAVQLAGTVQANGVAAGTTGGRITATGDSLHVAGRVEASGDAGGGTVLLGGGWQGKDASVRNARETTMSADAQVRVDATGVSAGGTGGTAVVWSDKYTRTGGLISARGIVKGGTIETSSKGTLEIAGQVDAGAASGDGGRWLIDPTYTTIGNTEALAIAGQLNAGTDVDIDSGSSISINEDINKISGDDALLTFRANGDITLATGKAISSTAGKLDVHFCGIACVAGSSGNAVINGQISTNGGNVVFFKPTTLASNAPISTKNLGLSGTSGNVTFHEDVTLASNSLAVNISTQGPQSGFTYLGNGGSVDFKGKIISGIAPLIGSLVPQALALDTTGVVPGAITLGDASADVVGSTAAPLAKLTLTGPTTISLEASQINLRAASGDVLVASSTLGTPRLVLGSATTDIRVTGGDVNGVVGYADYKQDTFNIGVKDASPRTLNITADRSIKIKNRVIDGETGAGASTLDINLKPYNASGATGSLALAGGGIIMETGTLLSNGGAINFGGTNPMDFAVGYGADIDGITDGVRIFNSIVRSKNGVINIRGRAPTTNDGGAGVRIFGLTEVNSGTGNINLDGQVTQISVSGNKDAVIIGEGSTSVTSLLASGSGQINITGDASSIGFNAAAGSRYNGVQISSGATIQTASGAINVTGRGGGGNENVSDRNNGIEMESLNTAILSTSGDITLTGVSGGKEDSFGILAKGNNMFIGKRGAGTASGIITLIGDTMNFVNTSSSRLQVSSTGELRIRPLSTGQNIEFGTAGQQDRLAIGNTWFNNAGNAVFLQGFSGITVGQAGLAGGVVESTGTLSVAGSTTVNDHLNLRMIGTGGRIEVNAPLTVRGQPSGDRTLSLWVNNGIGSNSSGIVTVDRLHLMGKGDMSLVAPNQINTVAGNSTTNAGADGIDGRISISNAKALNIDTASSISLGATSATAAGLITQGNKDVTVITSVGDLTLLRNVEAGTGTVRLGATTGAVNESGGMLPVVKAGRLAVTAQNTSSLNNVNEVATLAAATTGGTTADFTFIAKDAVVVDTVSGVTGVSVGGTAWIEARNGSITQLSPFVAGKAALTATTDIDLSLGNSTTPVNNIGTLAAAAGAGRIVHVVNSGALTVGSASTTAGTATSGTGGVRTGVGTTTGMGNLDVRLRAATGNITLANDINAGAATVALIANTGSVNENGSASAPAVTAPIVTAGTLSVTAGATSSLANDNAVATIAVSVGGAVSDFTFVGKDAVVVSQMTDLAGNTVSGLDVGRNAWLQAKNGSITQTHKASAVGLAAVATGNIALDLAPSTNTIGTLAAASAGGTVSLLNNAAVHVGTVGTASANATLGGPLRGVTTAGKDATIRTTVGGITLGATIGAGAGTLSLESAAGITQQSGDVVATNLRVLATGNVDMQSATNNAGTLAAAVSAPGGSFAYRDTDALTIGSVAVSLGGGAGTTSGVDTSAGNGEQYIRTGGALTITQNVAAGSGIVSFESGSSITQTGGGITADKLRIIAAGNVDAQSATNNVATLAAAVTGGTLAYNDTDALRLGTITGTLGSGVKTTSGVDTSSGNGEQFVKAGGPIVITHDLKAGTGAISLESGGSITQSGGGITADKLRVIAAGNTDLQSTTNNVATLAAAVSGGYLAYRDADALQVGSITRGIGLGAPAATSGTDTATGAGEQLIRTGGLLTLTQNVNAGTGIVSLDSDAGITQTGGALTADKLRIRSTGNVDMQQAANNAGTLAAQVGNGTLAYRDTDALTVGTVTGTLGTNALTTSGVDTATGNGEQLIKTGGLLTLTQNVAAGTGLVNLESGAGITQTAGAVTASGLRIIASGAVDMQTATNDVATLAASVGGSIAYRDTSALQVGSLTRSVGAGAPDTVTGVNTSGANGEQYIRTGGALSLTQNVAAGSGIVSFDSSAGITQTGGGITADKLRVISLGNVDLQSSTNAVNTFAAAVSLGSLALNNSTAMAVDTITGTLGSSALTTSGSDTATGNGEQYIRTGGALTLAQTVAAGGGTVSLESLAGISQTGAAVTADKLRVLAAGNVSLLQTGNTVNTLALKNTAGSAAYSNSAALTVGTVTGTLGSGDKTTTGVDTATGNGEQFIRTTAGAISLTQNVAAGSGLVSLESAAGIGQTGGAVTADGLRIIAAGNVDAQQTGNVVNTLAAQVSNGSLAYNNNAALAVGSLTGTLGGGVLATSGTDTSIGNGEQYIRTAGALSLAQNVAAGSGIVSFESAAGIAQTGGGVTADGLRVIAAGGIDLSQSANNVITVAAQSATGGISVRDADALTVGSVTGTLGSGVKTTTGLNSTGGSGDITVKTGGQLSLVTNVAAGAGAVALDNDGGVSQTAGVLTADRLSVIAGANVDLQRSGNNVTTLAGNITGGGGFLYRDSNALVIASVGSVTGLSAEGPIQVRAGTNLTLQQAVIGTAAVPNAVVLAAVNTFQNNAGVNGVSAPNGRWLIYDDNPTLDMSRLGGLQNAFLKTGVLFDGYPPSDVTELGTGYLTTVRPPPPEAFGRPTGGAAQPGTSGNTSANSTVSGYANMSGIVLARYSIDTGSPGTVIQGLGGSGQRFSAGVPVRVELQARQRFAVDMVPFLGGAQVEAISLADGEQLPSWLGFDANTRRFAGIVPAEPPSAVRVRLSVRDGDSRRDVVVEFALAR